MRADWLKLSILQSIKSLVWADSESLRNPALRLYLTVMPYANAERNEIARIKSMLEMKNYIAIGLIAILASCSPTQQQKSDIIDKKLISLPPLYEVTSIEIGLPMVEEGYEFREKAILLKSVPPLK